MKIAMWSGPRNLSTAMMYSFAQRADCTVTDEPFYAAYLAETGLEHPMRAEILNNQPRDPAAVIAELRRPIETPLHYQKHMTQHMLPGWDLKWMADAVNVFLIRHPARVIASYSAKREDPNADDLGFQRQFELFEHVKALGQTPIVVDSAGIRAAPESVLKRLCNAIGIPFDKAMLRWPKGENAADGVWAAHWYAAVHASEGFAAAEGQIPALARNDRALLSETMPIYRALRECAI